MDVVDLNVEEKKMEPAESNVEGKKVDSEEWDNDGTKMDVVDLNVEEKKMESLELKDEEMETVEMKDEEMETVDMKDEEMETVEVKVDEKMEAKKDGPLCPCDHFDVQLAHEIAQILLVGLATACVDNTTGAPFRAVSSIAAEFRKEMVDFLQHQSESFVAESVILDGVDESSDPFHPTEIISNMIDDFTATKRNLWSRVSGWLLSERREDNIDDVVQDLGRRGFWPIDRRKPVAEILLKNVDFKNEFHCGAKFDTPEELEEHKKICAFRVMNCENEGCRATFCAVYLENHDSTCPLKVLDCEQGCADLILRREMDHHCITVCPMKPVKCPFHQVGCGSSVPWCDIKNHCDEFLHSHILYVLQSIYKQSESEDDLAQRASVLEKSLSLTQKSRSDWRTLTSLVKQEESKMQMLRKNLDKVNQENTRAAASMLPQIKEQEELVDDLQEDICS
ncbi:unnamed protein product [Victoria cruziana]